MDGDTKDIFENILQGASDTFKNRNSLYKDGWVSHGEAMKALFPNGIVLESKEDFSRFLLFEMCASKLNRYAANFVDGGHEDSIHDLGVYSFILETYDSQLREKNDD